MAGHTPSNGGAAFPLPVAVGPSGDLYDASEADPGMSLRDWFAGQALVACMKAPPSESRQVGWQKSMAWDAYSIADAMIYLAEPAAQPEQEG